MNMKHLSVCCMDSTGSAKPIYEKMNEWQKQHEINAAATLNCLDNLDAQYKNGEISESEYSKNQSIFLDIYNDETEKIGYTFNFMEGKNPANQEDYMAQIAKLASGDFSSKDTDNDGQVTQTEYIMNEVYSQATNLSPEEKAQVATMALLAFQAIDSLVLADSNKENDINAGDNLLDVNDFQNLYKTLDGFNFNEETGSMAFNSVFDGELDMDSFDAFLKTTTANVSQESQQKLYDKFLGIFSK